MANSDGFTATERKSPPALSLMVELVAPSITAMLPPVTNKIYVSNQQSDNVMVIDGATNFTTTVSEGTSPFSLENLRRQLREQQRDGDRWSDQGHDHRERGDGPLLGRCQPGDEQIYSVNLGSDNVTVIDGATNSTTTLHVGTHPFSVAANLATNKVYVANLVSDNVTVIDGATNSTTTVSAGNGSYSVAVNAVTNKIYVANNGIGSTTVTVIDGATNSTTSFTAEAPWSVAVTNRVYVPNTVSDSVTVITEQQVQTIPLTTTISPLPGNRTSSPTPTFTFNATSTFSPNPTTPADVFFQVDTWQGPGSGPTALGGG